MKRSLQGKYIKTNTTGETVNAFIPAPLPPNPPIDWGNGLRNRFDNALLALGRLDGMALLLPDINFLLYMYVRKEAVLSSMIEGTQSSLSDLLLYEAQQKCMQVVCQVRYKGKPTWNSSVQMGLQT